MIFLRKFPHNFYCTEIWNMIGTDILVAHWFLVFFVLLQFWPSSHGFMHSENVLYLKVLGAIRGWVMDKSVSFNKMFSHCYSC